MLFFYTVKDKGIYVRLTCPEVYQPGLYNIDDSMAMYKALELQGIPLFFVL